MPYLILCRQTLHRHDAPACINTPSAIIRRSLKWKEECGNRAVPPNTFLGAHLQLSVLIVREPISVSEKLPRISHIHFQPFH